MLDLRTLTPPQWVQAVLDNFDRFLLDHAACERKAAATGMSFIVRYPDRKPLLEPLIEFAKEELDHFHQVVRIINQRGLVLPPDEKDRYVTGLLQHVRNGRDARLLDRLLVSAIVEARGCERFGLVAEALPPGPLKDFYTDLTRSEARHHSLFLRLARTVNNEEEIAARLPNLLEQEAKIIEDLPFRGTLH